MILFTYVKLLFDTLSTIFAFLALLGLRSGQLEAEKRNIVLLTTADIQAMKNLTKWGLFTLLSLDTLISLVQINIILSGFPPYRTQFTHVASYIFTFGLFFLSFAAMVQYHTRIGDWFISKVKK